MCADGRQRLTLQSPFQPAQWYMLTPCPTTLRSPTPCGFPRRNSTGGSRAPPDPADKGQHHRQSGPALLRCPTVAESAGTSAWAGAASAGAEVAGRHFGHFRGGASPQPEPEGCREPPGHFAARRPGPTAQRRRPTRPSRAAKERRLEQRSVVVVPRACGDTAGAWSRAE